MAGKSGEPGRGVAPKVFAVLDAFEDAGPSGALRLTDIARRTGLPAPTALRLVRELVAWGGLEQFGDGSYRLGTRLWALGGRSPCPHRLREAARAPLAALAAATGGRAELAVLDGGCALVLESALRLPPHATALGKVLLAGAARQPAYDPVRLTPHTRTAPGLLAAELREVRARGYALSQEEFRLGELSVAVPVRGRDGAVSAAVGVSARSTEPAGRLLPHVRRAAARTAAALDGGT